ncbi:MAG: adenylate/guanylate cyclase domain-containing protein [Acidiferrobacteraceae bacterium]|jgi:adenylate cyclase|nr:adenylate/guanylate cyclase domain-containing protein [Acidiferrobacteraceae bacterium]MDP6792064.1 adenylate/guanylate cyclase domain-containing protein [Arenicellales bacterium]MDP6919893.1 adenylate/guanylate cyclase domain-containing protein [Arenicellales bacterium]|tara:strand:- start:4186 stop:6015 length:1830 start_codon:yes stop_codon:yes gene_type:complete
MTDPKPRRKLAAILAADVVNFSAMMGDDEDRTLKNLKACRALTDECITANHGRIFGSAGDSIIAEFASPVDAVVAATEFQRSLKQRNDGVSADDRMQFRVGLNLGDVIVEGDNLYGDGVNVAARLEALAEPGGISLSGKFHEEVCRKLDITFVSTGEQEMKNIRSPVDTYKIEISTLAEMAASSDAETAPAETPAVAAPSEAAENKPPAIAVLPFANMSGDPEQDFFVDGITEDIITNLSLWRNFPVISRNSSFTYKDKSVNLKDVAQELGVRYIVEGSVRKGGQRVRITAQLIDAEQDHHLWSQKWDRNLEDIFEVQDEVSTSIAAQVNPTLGSYERERIERSKPDNYSAWEYYLRSLQMFNDRHSSDGEDENLAESRRLCEKALELDPNFSLAYSMLANICHWELMHFTRDNSDEILDEMHELAKKSAELDPQNPMAALMISSYYFFTGNFSQSAKYAEKSLELNPSSPEAYGRAAGAMIHVGEYEKPEEYLRKSVEINPIDPKLMDRKANYFFIYLGMQDYQKAYDLIEEVIAELPNSGMYRGFKAAVMGYLDKGEEAKQALGDYLALRPNLKTREDFRKIFVPNSALADILIEGLIRAGWEPEGG